MLEGFADCAGLWRSPEALDQPDAVAALQQYLTVLVCTSPALSDPSTALLEKTTASFRLVDGLRACRTIVVCDGWRAKPDVDFMPHSGTINSERSRNYVERIDRLQQAIVEPGSWAESHWEILRLPEWCGYGQALKAGLSQIYTPLVLVVQHDYVFVQPVPLLELMQTFSCADLEHSLNYIGLCKNKQLNYKENIKRRRGLDLEVSLVANAGAAPIELLQLPQLYDSTHIARVEWYLSLYAQDYMHGDTGARKTREDTHGIPRGYFPEDVLSGHMLRLANEAGVQNVVDAFGTYLWLQQGAVIQHINGRQFLTSEQKEAFKPRSSHELKREDCHLQPSTSPREDGLCRCHITTIRTPPDLCERVSQPCRKLFDAKYEPGSKSSPSLSGDF